MRNIWEWERVTDRDNSHNQKPWILQHNCPHVIWRKNWHVQSRLELNVRNYWRSLFYKKTFVHWLFFFCDMISVFLAILIFRSKDFSFLTIICKPNPADQVKLKIHYSMGMISLKQKGAHDLIECLYSFSFSGSDSSAFLASEASVSADSSVTVKSATPGAVPFPVPLAIPFPLDSGFFSEV